MPALAQTDLRILSAASMPESDSTTSGGAVDATALPAFVDVVADGYVEALSSDAGDTTQTATVTGLDSDGAAASEVLTLAGLTVVGGVQAFSRVDKVALSASCAGTVTVRRAPSLETVVALAPAMRAAKKLFYAAAAHSTSRRQFYEKLFLENAHGTDALNSARVRLAQGFVEYAGTAQGGGATFVTLDAGASAVDGFYQELYVVLTAGTGAGQSRRVSAYAGATRRASVPVDWSPLPDATSEFELHAVLVNVESSKNGSNSSANRLTAPSSMDAGGWRTPGALLAVPTGAMAAGDRIGVWLQFVRPPGADPVDGMRWRLELLGSP